MRTQKLYHPRYFDCIMPQQYQHIAHTYLLSHFVSPQYVAMLEPLVYEKTLHLYTQQSEQDLWRNSDTLFSVLLADVCQQIVTTIDQTLQKQAIPDFLGNINPEQTQDIVDIYHWKTEQFEWLMNRYNPKIHSIIGRFVQQYPSLQSYKTDVYQETVLLLWEQLSRNKLSRFEGTSLFSTFFHSVIRWIVIRAVKQLKPIEQKIVDVDSWDNVEPSINIKLVEQQANEGYASLLPQHLQTIQYFTVSLTSTDRNKLLFSWQLLYNILFTMPSDVQQYYPHCSSDLFLDILLVQQQKNTKEQVFEQLPHLIKQLTFSEISKEALKKWLNRKRQMVYNLLFTAYLIENKNSEINAYWELLIRRFFAQKPVYSST